MRRSQDAWNSLPTFIKDVSAFPRETQFEKYVSDATILGFRYNDFLLQRALVKRAQMNNHDLIAASIEVFSIVLNIIHHNSTNQFACDMPWIVSCFLITQIRFLRLTCHQGRTVCAPSRWRARSRALAANPPPGTHRSVIPTVRGDSGPQQSGGRDEVGHPKARWEPRVLYSSTTCPTAHTGHRPRS